MSTRAKFNNLLRKLGSVRSENNKNSVLMELFQFCLDNPELLSTDSLVRANANSFAMECHFEPTCPNDVKDSADRVIAMIDDELPQRANYRAGGGRRRATKRRARKAKKSRRNRK